MKKNVKTAFTLVETLIALVIIGIIAALTIPSVLKNYSDHKYNAARLKAKMSIGEAFRLISMNGEISHNLTTEDMVRNVIPKYIKVTKICSTPQECNMPEVVKKPNGQTVAMPLTWTETTNNKAYGVTVEKAIGQQATDRNNPTSEADRNNNTVNNYNNSFFFETVDGFHINIFYNPYCAIDSKDKAYNMYIYTRPLAYAQLVLDTVCFNAIYDMNGTKGPNQVGKDIGFLGSFYNGTQAQSAAVLPYKAAYQTYPWSPNNFWSSSYNYCKTLDGQKWDMPDINELSLIFLNDKIVNNTNTTFWAKNRADAVSSWTVHFDKGRRTLHGGTDNNYTWVLCVRRTGRN